METREIKALLALMQEYELLELEIDDKKRGKVRLVRAGRPREAVAAPPPGQSTTAALSRHVRAPAREGGKAAAPELAENQRLIVSPMVGTFYRASSPDADPFVEEGDSVRKGQTLCIIEAMKMMNEIEAEVAGRVVKVLCENAQPVEYGQPLVIVEIG
ncbi:MAG TPA: acetyl-CoA carboxylase biotin carboxyl carrier protein [Candidatus Binataceae bacterium]|nr:acetyl-CoA carboxylase biotin carboxyl carrier protein [Candidatus Binataceae bacterium]